jgi:chromosome segregation ATPase
MAEEKTPVTSTSVVNTEENSSTYQAHATAQVAMALGALDSRYKENIADYAKELHAYTHKIENARIELKLLNEQKAPHSNALLSLEKEVEYGLRMLEHLTEQWLQKVAVVNGLEQEMKRMDVTMGSDGVLQHRREDLKQLHDEIEDHELTLLKNELERQNLVLKIEPIDQKIRALEKKIQEYEAQKRYMESAHLHRITQVASMEQPKLPPLDQEESSND